MTYDVLNKVSKRDLIQWMKKNIFLPDISDKEFLRDVELESLFAKERELLEADKQLNKKLQKVCNNQAEFLRLMVEAEKLNEKINQVSERISILLNISKPEGK